uniref:PWWP domain-containing protein n=1 Tax=Anopheles melas TaxID=34690 RepID=A0A182TWR0_9DIPT
MEEELSDGDIVWVKVSNSWWPGEVMGSSRLTEEFLSSLRKKPLAVVKFFQEDSYEYVKNPNFIFKYNCPRKHEFLRKGLEQYRAKMKHMEKFPADVMHAERATGGDPDIVNSTDYLPQKKERHSGAFQDGRSPAGKGKGLKEKPNTPAKLNTPPFSFGSGRKTIHEVRILAQPSNAPSDGEAGVSLPTDKMSPAVGAHSVQSSPSQVYHCYKCNNYSANRQNLIMLHIKHCRATYAIGSGGGGAGAGGAGGSVGAVSSANTSTPTAPARKASSEKMDESAEEVDPEPDIKPDRARRSLPVADKAKPLETPIRNVDVAATVKSEPLSSEKRTRGGRKTTSTVQAPKQKKGRQNKPDQSSSVLDEGKQASAKVSEHEDARPSANVDVAVEDEKEENNRQQRNRGKGSGSVSHEESPTQHAVKNKTDVKLKNELLADWSEDEQEDDEGDKLVGGVENVEEKNPTKESRKDTPPKDVSPVRTTKASTRKQQKDTKQETKQQPLASKKTAKPEAKNETVALAKKDAESVTVKETEKDPESPPESSTVVAATVPPVTAATAGSVTAAVVSTSSASSAAPIVSPHATIKYRNIPKKQKREFIEVTNDDVSMVQEKYAVPSREGSTASSSSTTGSNESCAGPSQSIVPPTAPAAERPISAKQLILNRATRGSSKSLSGDEITAATASVSTDHTTPSVSTDTNAVQEERKSHIDDSAKKTDVQQQETSCFDFNDDEDVHQQEKVSPASQTSLMTARVDRKRDQAVAAREKPTTVEPEPSEVDRDAQLSQEIDSLLGETNVPKLPEDLSDVMTAVSDKIDCNRTLPPKERGKRIFKTRNKTVTASSSSSPKRDDTPVGEEVAPSEGSVPAEAANNNGESSSSASDVVKDKADKEQQPQQQEASEEETQTVKGKDEFKNREDDQNPSVTSSAMTDEGLPEDKELQQKEQHQSAKKKRKSDEVLLPDSSGNGDQPTVPAATRRRGKYSKTVTDVHEKSAGDKSVSTQPVSEAREPSSVSRKAKRLQATNLPQSKKVAAVVEPPMMSGGIEKEITTVKVVLPPEEDPPSIPEKKKRNEVLSDGEEMASKESSPVSAGVEKLDINSMPIVMDEGELLVDETSSIPAPAGAITVMKSVNGAGGGAAKPPLVATTSKDKRQTTVAMVRGGKASTEQIVITSKGTVLTTSTASVSVASKFPSSTKSSVTVTSAITLSSSCRVASSTPAPSVSSPPSSASSAAAPQLVPPKIIITKKPLPHAASTSTASSKSASAEGSVGSKAHDRRVSGDGASHSSSARPTSLPEVASSGSNVVIAAAADSSVQESSTTVGRTASADPSAVDMEEDEEMLEQQKGSSGEAGELPASTHVAPAGGAAILLEGSPSSSGAGAAEVVLGSSELAIVGGGSVTEASSSSTGGSGSGTTATGEQESSQLIAVPAENFGGPPHLFYLCSVRDESLVPVNNELLYLDASNQLVALPEQHQQHPSQQQQQQQQQHQGQQQQAAGTLTEEIINQAEVIIPTVGGSNGAEMGGDGTGEGSTTAIANATGAVGSDGAQEGFVFNTQDGQHIILDPQSLMALAASGDTPHLITADGQEIILQETAQEWLAALSAGQHAQQQQAGAVSTLVTPEGTQIIVAHENAGLIELQEHPVLLPTEIIQVNPNTTVETNAVLTKPPIMSTVEVPTKNGIESASRIGDRKLAAAVSPRMSSGSTTPAAGASATSSSSSNSSGKALTSTITAGSGSNLDETLAAVIGHVPSNPHVPTSLELPITVTNPVIAKTSTASSRLNATAPLFPLTTTAATVVSSFADAIPAAATVVLVSGADAPAEGQEARKDNGAEQEELEKESEEASMMTVQLEEGNDDGDHADDGGGDASGKEKSACFDEDDIQIPSTPESAQNNDERQQYDDELMASDDEQREPNENHLLLANENSNCSEIIAIQPNVVVLDGDMLLNSPENEDDDADDDDGIDDDLMENESEEDGVMTVQQQQQQQQVVQDVVQGGRSFDQRPPQQAHRARSRVPPAANGANGRPDNMVNLAEHHNSSSNNDSGIDTSMAAGGVAACEAAAASSSGEGTPTTVRRPIVER